MDSGALTRAACRSMTESASRVWLATTAGTPRFENTGLLGGDGNERIAEEIAMIERQPRDHARQWAFDHVGGVKAAAKPDFEQQNVSRVAGEQQKGRRRLHLKHCDRRVAIVGLAFGERIGEFVIARQTGRRPLALCGNVR